MSTLWAKIDNKYNHDFPKSGFKQFLVLLAVEPVPRFVLDWTVTDVCDWLDSLFMPEYKVLITE